MIRLPTVDYPLSTFPTSSPLVLFDPPGFVVHCRHPSFASGPLSGFKPGWLLITLWIFVIQNATSLESPFLTPQSKLGPSLILP